MTHQTIPESTQAVNELFRSTDLARTADEACMSAMEEVEQHFDELRIAEGQFAPVVDQFVLLYPSIHERVTRVLKERESATAKERKPVATLLYACKNEAAGFQVRRLCQFREAFAEGIANGKSKVRLEWWKGDDPKATRQWGDHEVTRETRDCLDGALVMVREAFPESIIALLHQVNLNLNRAETTSDPAECNGYLAGRQAILESIAHPHAGKALKAMRQARRAAFKAGERIEVPGDWLTGDPSLYPDNELGFYEPTITECEVIGEALHEYDRAGGEH